MVSSVRESGLKSLMDSSGGPGRSPLARVDDGPARKPGQDALSSLVAVWMVRVLPFGHEWASPTQSQVLRVAPPSVGGSHAQQIVRPGPRVNSRKVVPHIAYLCSILSAVRLPVQAVLSLAVSGWRRWEIPFSTCSFVRPLLHEPSAVDPSPLGTRSAAQMLFTEIKRCGLLK